MLTDLLLGKYSVLILGTEFPVVYVRNFLFVGIPFFTIGMWLREKEGFVIRDGMRNMSAAIVLLFCMTTLLEKYFLVTHDCNATQDHYLSSTFLAIAVFLFFVNTQSANETGMSKVGRNDSLYIYILHPIFFSFFSVINGHLPDEWNTIYSYTAPVMVFGITCIFSKTLRVVIKRFKLISQPLR